MSRSRFIAVAVTCLIGFHHASGAASPNIIVQVENGYVVGAANNGKWLDSAKAAALLKPQGALRVYGLTSEMGTASAGKPESVEEPCPETQMVKLSRQPKDAAIALTASWNALPRKPRSSDVTQPVYVQAVREFLEGNGLKDPKVKITQILRIDLEGDGEDEVLISATNYLTKKEGMPSSAVAGSYSFVLLRRVVAGKVKTQLVVGEFYPKGKEFSAPNRYSVLAILDLDGDGKMEVIVESAYYEGGATTIYRCAPTKIEELLSTGCGA